MWYLVADEGHNADGKHVPYLDTAHKIGARLRALDPDLYDRLARVVANGDRSVRALENSGALPPGATTYTAVLGFSHLAPTARVKRQDHRRGWLLGALDAVRDCDLVFVDPDNGLRRGDHPTPSHRTRSEKPTYLDELRHFTARGQSVIAYHHADRSAPVHEQARRRLGEAEAELR